jgi:hypothetical protein
LEPNPRKVKRALNIYRTVLELADKRVRVWEMDPINDELAAKIVILQSRFRKLHEYLPQQPEFLPEIEAWVSKIDESNVAELKDLAKRTRENQLEYLNLKYGDEEERDLGIRMETGLVLLGSKDEKGLIETGDLVALRDLLQSGKMQFSGDAERDQINSYIYLIATAEGSATGVRPNRKERDALLGGEPDKISAQVEEIQQREKEAAYIERLEGVLVDHSRYSPAEVASANLALDQLEGWQREEFEPETVRVPAGSFLMGSTPQQVAQAIEDGAEEEWVQPEQPQHSVELPGYRIGKYPVTNQEYQAFVGATNHHIPGHWENGRYPQGKMAVIRRAKGTIPWSISPGNMRRLTASGWRR